MAGRVDRHRGCPNPDEADRSEPGRCVAAGPEGVGQHDRGVALELRLGHEVAVVGTGRTKIRRRKHLSVCPRTALASQLGPARITYRFTKEGRIILLTTFRKQRNNERNEIGRARKAAKDCAKRYP